jgi:hypothetical protein
MLLSQVANCCEWSPHFARIGVKPVIESVKETIMKLRSISGARIRSRWALPAMISMALLLSPAAQAQHMHGSWGHFGGHIASAPHHFSGSGGNFSGFHHHGFARGFHHHGFAPFVVLGGAGFFYPYPYYDAYDSPAYMTPQAPVWYYCQAAGAYYPNVTTCAGGWTVVPATPNQTYPAPIN